jgi:hypothetical protein
LIDSADVIGMDQLQPPSEGARELSCSVSQRGSNVLGVKEEILLNYVPPGALER